jgi:hypothetical protein
MQTRQYVDGRAADLDVLAVAMQELAGLRAAAGLP